MKNKVYTGVWVPKKILSAKVKNGNERLLLAMIYELSKKGGCTASNDYFSKLLFLSESQISKIISKLKKKKIINHFVDKKQGNKRTLSINADTLYANSDIAICKNADTLYANSDINIIEDKIYINTSTTTEKLKSNIDLINSIVKENKISKEEIYNKIETFTSWLVNTKRVKHKDDNDLYTHFTSWINKYNKDSIAVNDKEIDWFMDHFNRISKGKYRKSSEITQAFAIQRKNGFTGVEMVCAIENLYSSAEENKFHRESNFKHATPKYLLDPKKDNINKYLNVRWGKKPNKS